NGKIRQRCRYTRYRLSLFHGKKTDCRERKYLCFGAAEQKGPL
ncbi:hypothetical protein DYADSP32_1722, partial [Dyadobacter sp. 32]